MESGVKFVRSWAGAETKTIPTRSSKITEKPRMICFIPLPRLSPTISGIELPSWRMDNIPEK